jgi:carboxymethylenebutenolidase
MSWIQRILPTTFTPWQAAAVLVAAFSCPAAPAAAEEGKIPISFFSVADKPVRVEHFRPRAKGRHPAVILLHGTEGLPDKDKRLYRYYAGVLAREGYVALLVHYFDSTKTRRIDPEKVEKKLFLAWKDAVRGAVRHAGTLPQVDPKRIALLGFSLGACLSLAVAAEADPPVAATVELFGYLPKEFGKHARRLPPTLIVHGGADRVVPVAKAHELEKLLKEHGRTYEIKIYQGQGHLFGAKVVDADALDAQKRTLGFLAKHLKTVDAAHAR